MRIIGVLDLMNGGAVHARGGRRDEYAPVRHAAGHAIDGDPLTLARTYRQQLGIDELYAADLDAITGGSRQDAPIRALAGVAPLWLDAGVSSIAAARRASRTGAARVIVGLETLSSFDALGEICAALGGERVAFSLDLRGGIPLAAADVGTSRSESLAVRAAGAGVGAILVLDLARVGSGSGPDFDLIGRIREAVPAVTLVTGGGIRHGADLARLADAGCDGALAATALHDGRITAADVAEARQRQASTSR